VTAPSRPIRAHSNDSIFKYLCNSTGLGSTELRRLCHPRALSWYESADGLFHDILLMCPTRSRLRPIALVDPWHEASDLAQPSKLSGFDVFFTSGVTRGLPAMMPVALLYDTPRTPLLKLHI